MDSIVGLVVSLIPVIAWIMTLWDIHKSDFENDNKWKRFWFWSVLLTGYVAMMLYYIIGIKRKVKAFQFLRSASIYKYC